MTHWSGKSLSNKHPREKIDSGSLRHVSTFNHFASLFGSEKHDHAVDALVYLILGLVGEGIEEQKVHYVSVTR
jgi:hypothetical protein